MDYEPEMIKQQMSETRSSLGDKLETLEQKVTETVKDATRAVSETVQTVSETVDSTVSNISESVETVKESVKETFNLTGHIERNPWLALGASVAAGYALGVLLPTPRRWGSRPRPASRLPCRRPRSRRRSPPADRPPLRRRNRRPGRRCSTSSRGWPWGRPPRSLATPSPRSCPSR